MNLLFVHQNYPAQFRALAPTLARKGHQVRALTMRANPPPQWEGVSLTSYTANRGSTPGVHPWVADLETKVIRGEAAHRAATALRSEGFVPDVIIGHPGWGECLFLKEVWPKAKLGLYCEFFYSTRDADVGFDPEFPEAEGSECRLAMKNLHLLPVLRVADAGIAPTHWQASRFPEEFRSRITVIHDGVDTQLVSPGVIRRTVLPSGKTLAMDDEVVTFVNRNLEPYRGYHVFMRALIPLLKQRPRLQVLIVGGDGCSYGSSPPVGKTWKQIYADEARAGLESHEWDRVHFLGQLPYPQFISLLQRSTVHVYLTYPFVLGWSLLEAMSAGCAIVASDTASVTELIDDGQQGLLVPFFEPDRIAERVMTLLDAPAERRRLGTAARARIVRGYDLRTVCLPRQIAWVESLVDSTAGR